MAYITSVIGSITSLPIVVVSKYSVYPNYEKLKKKGCLGNGDGNDAVFYKGIETAEIPMGCIDYKDDVCALFDCMVDLY